MTLLTILLSVSILLNVFLFFRIKRLTKEQTHTIVKAIRDDEAETKMWNDYTEIKNG